MKLSFSEAGAAFIERLMWRRAQRHADPVTDWQAATCLVAAAPSSTVPAWQIAAVACTIDTNTDDTDNDQLRRPDVLYAFGPKRRLGTGGQPIHTILAALAARALVRSARTDAYLIGDHLPADEADRLLAALGTGDAHQRTPVIATTSSVGRYVADPEAGYMQIAAGLIRAPRAGLVDLAIGELRRGRSKPLTKLDDADRRLLGAVALAAEAARREADDSIWVPVRPDGTTAAAWAHRSASTTIMCATCSSIEANCAASRAKHAVEHGQRWGADPDQPAVSGLSGISRTRAA